MSWFGLQLLRHKIPCPRTIVETGAYYGDGIENMLKSSMFDTIHSIELSPRWVAHCRARFAEHADTVHIHEGDSATVLPTLALPNTPVIFYLDAHFSGGTTAGADIDNGCPVLRELQTIAARNVPGDIIFVDDMRLMGKESVGGEIGSEIYPRTTFDFRHVTPEAIHAALSGRTIVHMSMCTAADMVTEIDRLLIVLG